MVRRFRVGGLRRARRATPRAPRTRRWRPRAPRRSRSTKTAPCSLQRLDDVPVVHDLLAHVDRGAVALQRLLDGLHRPVDAGAVAARFGQQHPLSAVLIDRTGLGRAHDTDVERDCRRHAPQDTEPARHDPPPRHRRTPSYQCRRLSGRLGAMIRPPYLARVAAGAAVYAIEESRKLPAAAVMLPMTALSQLLQTTMHLQQFITSLAIRATRCSAIGAASRRRCRSGRPSTRTSVRPAAGERTRDPCRAVRAVLDAAARTSANPTANRPTDAR